jgi:hypothetical protein
MPSHCDHARPLSAGLAALALRVTDSGAEAGLVTPGPVKADSESDREIRDSARSRCTTT